MFKKIGLYATFVLIGTHFTQAVALTRMDVLKIQAEELLLKAVSFFKKNGLDRACASFAHQEEWRTGPITIFVLDVAGRILVDVHNTQQTWRSYGGVNNFGPNPLVAAMASIGQKGGWIAHKMFNSMRHAYVKSLTKGNDTYILGANFFDDSLEITSVTLVGTIKRYWERLGTEKVLEIVSNPVGSLVVGAIHGIVMDLKGACLAHGSNALLVGQSLLDPRSVGDQAAAGFKEVLSRIMKRQDKKVWVDFKENQLIHRRYAELLTDSKTQKEFIIMAGFYPQVTEKTVVDVALGVASVLQNKSLNEALKEFAYEASEVNKGAQSAQFGKGNLNVIILDEAGKVLLYGSRDQAARYLGRNLLEYVDERKRPYNRILMSALEKSPSAWVSRFNNHSLERIYGQKVETPTGNLIIEVTGYYPSMPEELAQVLVDDAYNYLKEKPYLEVLRALGDPASRFVKGGLQIAVYDAQGVCWAHGISPNFRWQQDVLIPKLAEGWTTDERSKNNKRIYLRKLTKQVAPGRSEEWALCSSYYQII